MSGVGGLGRGGNVLKSAAFKDHRNGKNEDCRGFIVDLNEADIQASHYADADEVQRVLKDRGLKKEYEEFHRVFLEVRRWLLLFHSTPAYLKKN